MKKIFVLFGMLLIFSQSVEAGIFSNPYYNQNYNQNYNPYYNSNGYYNNYRAPLFTRSSGSSWKSTMWNNFRNQLTGTPTGFTPTLDPAYMDYFEAERANRGEDVDIRTNHGYYQSHKNRGATTGVTILED